MAIVILVRHGRSTANAGGVLAGRLPGIELDDVGREQARKVGTRLAPVPLVSAVSSPLERCRQTAEGILGERPQAPSLEVDYLLTECDYGQWAGKSIKDLAGEDLWRTVQDQPSVAAFPEGESIRAMSARAVEAVRRRDLEVTRQHGPDAVWLAVSHGDVIKSVLADAYGMHLDHFQRVVVDPASVSIVRYTQSRPYVLAVNTHGGDLAWLAERPKQEIAPATASGESDAVVGGGAGPGDHHTRA